MREVALELPKVRWEDVGGLDAIKQRLREAVEWPQKHPELLKRLGAKVSLLAGAEHAAELMLAHHVLMLTCQSDADMCSCLMHRTC